jgi:hypothetical protein
MRRCPVPVADIGGVVCRHVVNVSECLLGRKV